LKALTLKGRAGMGPGGGGGKQIASQKRGGGVSKKKMSVHFRNQNSAASGKKDNVAFLMRFPL